MEFWPFNIESGPDFLAFYLMFAIVVLTAAFFIAKARGDSEDRPSAGAGGVGVGDDADPYRSPTPSEQRSRLTVGSIPRPDEIAPIAYLRDGVRGVAEVLLCHAIAAGWLHDARGAEPAADRTFDEMRAHLAAQGVPDILPSVAHAEARNVAIVAEGDLRAQLEAAGLLRTTRAASRARGVVIVAGMLVLVVGVLRAIRGVTLEHPIGFLVIEMLAVFAAFVGLANAAGRRGASAAGVSYLGWLDSSTLSLSRDVCVGRRSTPHEVGLIVAVAGATAVMSVPLFAGLEALLLPPPPPPQEDSTWSNSSSCSSSNCSSSSCGSSSCGGGGGCGG